MSVADERHSWTWWWWPPPPRHTSVTYREIPSLSPICGIASHPASTYSGKATAKEAISQTVSLWWLADWLTG